MKKFLAPFAFLFITILSYGQKKELYLLVGTYTGGKSEGIYVYRFNMATGEARLVNSVKTFNPSYLAVSSDGKFVYAVNEKDDTSKTRSDGKVSAFAFDKKTGSLQFLNQQSSGGRHPCYLAIDKTGRWLTTGNYSSGSIGLLGIRRNGLLDTLKQRVDHTGYSVNADRQTGPHVHCTYFSKDNRYLFATDLGTDKIMIYRFNEKTGKLSENNIPYAITEAGAGPRHLEFHPKGTYAYLVEELNGTVSAFYYLPKQGQLNMFQTISALPPEYSGAVGSADIHVSPDGKFLYATNRGESNSIATFSIEKDGTLRILAHDSTMGKTPRNFNMDPSGKFLLVANQNSDNIVIFERDISSGLLTDTGKRIDVGKPVCLKWSTDN
jgi:6-phosphogluconolactonase